jgi:hypothetical protein
MAPKCRKGGIEVVVLIFAGTSREVEERAEAEQNRT